MGEAAITTAYVIHVKIYIMNVSLETINIPINYFIIEDREEFEQDFMFLLKIFNQRVDYI